ncbi:MAG: tetratricopeptide repeat protein [Flavobacteriia bacterium]|jgi:tetratricopeptide (TPR) repeat protein
MNPITAEYAKFKEEIYIAQADIKSAYYERAINKLHELIVHYPGKAEPYYELAQLAYHFWRNDEAEANYIKALQADPNYFPTYTMYAFILIKEQRFDEAEGVLENAKKLRSRDDADIYFYFGMLNQHKGETDIAINYYNKAIQSSINQNQIDLNLKFIAACTELRGWE